MLKKQTGKDNIHDMVEIFVEQEETNYSIFTYINELNDELEQLTK